jgi:hypothetical protein
MKVTSIENEVQQSRKHRSDPLSDIRSVGLTKPVGYLPLSTIKRLGGNMKTLSAEAKRKGFIVQLYREGEAPIVSGALFVASPVALTKLLEKNKDTVAAFGWSSNPETFLEEIATRQATPKTKLFDIVADAFADYENQNRTNISENTGKV